MFQALPGSDLCARIQKKENPGRRRSGFFTRCTLRGARVRSGSETELGQPGCGASVGEREAVVAPRLKWGGH